MIVHRLELEQFRNYETADVSFSDSVNVITGRNAQGKTNLLEAIYLLTGNRSFRTRFDRELITFDRDLARIRAEVSSQEREQRLELVLPRGGKRRLTANGVKMKTSAEFSGRVRAVVFCPDDLNIIRSSAAQRRKLLDLCLCQMRPRYAAALSEYTKLYENKSRILKDWHEKPSLLEALDEFNLQLCRRSAQIMYYRANVTEHLARYAAEIHRQFSDRREELTVRYKTMGTVPDPTAGPEELLGPIIEHQRTHREAEIASGLCLSGIHKDDLEIEISARSARQYASQGQTRTAALSVKMAEREILRADSGEYPILLLDDVLSELDAGRQNYVLNLIDQGQVFITCCDGEAVTSRTGGRVLTVDGGNVVQS